MQGFAARRGREPGRIGVHQEPLREETGWYSRLSRTALLPEEGPTISRSLHRETPDGSLRERHPLRDVRCRGPDERRELDVAPYCPMVPSTSRAPFVLMPSVTAPSSSACSRRAAR